jgi:hypothetical protein
MQRNFFGYHNEGFSAKIDPKVVPHLRHGNCLSKDDFVPPTQHTNDGQAINLLICKFRMVFSILIIVIIFLNFVNFFYALVGQTKLITVHL